MGNPVTHWQILSRNPEAAEKFYSELFGWKCSAPNALGYRTVDTNSGKGINGGIWPIGGNEGHPMVQLFVAAEDVSASVEKAQKLGAKVVIPPQKLPDGDEMAVLMDLDGIPFALMRAKK